MAPSRTAGSAGPGARLPVALAATALALTSLVGCTGDDAPTAATPEAAPSVTGPHDRSDVTTNPAAVGSGPGIDRFDAPASVPCTAGATASVDVTWAAPAATVVRFSVDGDGLAGDHPTTGSASLAVPCDGVVHVVLVAAVVADGATSVDSAAVLTEPTG